jgi:heterodisulfide reductase subunit D
MSGRPPERADGGAARGPAAAMSGRSAAGSAAVAGRDLVRRESLICARCGACRDVCPIYRAGGWESDSPRGRMQAVRDLYARTAPAGPGVAPAPPDDDRARVVGRCTLCGACGTSCAAAIDTREVWLAARAELATEGRPLAAYQRLATLLERAKNVAAADNDDRLDWTDDLDEATLEPGVVGAEVCYFVGCVASFYPRAAQVPLAFAEVLGAAGVSVTVLGGEEWCCGYPLEAAGFVAEAGAFREHNLQAIVDLGVKVLVTACPSCHHTFAGEGGEVLRAAGVRVLHATQFMLEAVERGQLSLGEVAATATFHDPCDLGRNHGIYDEPRELLGRIPGLTFVELERCREEAACCGGGGDLQSVDPGLTERIADQRIDEVVRSGAQILVSACQQCEQVLDAAVRRRGAPIRVVDLCELVWESLE